MPKSFSRNSLAPESQPWGRDVESSIRRLEDQVTSLESLVKGSMKSLTENYTTASGPQADRVHSIVKTEYLENSFVHLFTTGINHTDSSLNISFSSEEVPTWSKNVTVDINVFVDLPTSSSSANVNMYSHIDSWIIPVSYWNVSRPFPLRYTTVPSARYVGHFSYTLSAIPSMLISRGIDTKIYIGSGDSLSDFPSSGRFLLVNTTTNFYR